MSRATESASEIIKHIDRDICSGTSVSKQTTVEFLEAIMEHCECIVDCLKEEIQNEGEEEG